MFMMRGSLLPRLASFGVLFRSSYKSVSMDKREGKKGDSFAIDNLGDSVHDARAAQILVVSLSKAGEKGHRINICQIVNMKRS